jgi:basic membrane protein A and related proteins
MTQRMVRRRSTVWAAGAATLLLVGGAFSTLAQSPGTSTAPGTSKVTRVGIVAPEKATDMGWNQQGVDGATEAAQSVGAQIDVAAEAGYGDVAPVLRQLQDDGSNFIVAQGSGYATTAAQFAAQSGVPVIVYDAPTLTTPGLVADVVTNAQQGAYLAGVLAAKMTKTNTLGMVISADTPSWHKANGGFVTGAQSVNPNIKFVLQQIGKDAYGDQEGGKRTTDQIIAAGADVVFGQGDGASFGMLQSVETATPPAGADKVWFIDVVGDKTSIDDKGVLLSSVLWNFGGTFKQAIADIDAGTFGAKGYVQDLANGGIALLQTSNITADAQAAIDAAKAGIAAGTIVIPETTTLDSVKALYAGS